jgi:primosomal protein N' (replication factor Y)
VTVQPNYAEVLLPLKLTQAYTYKIPDELKGQVDVGISVLVSFGRNKFYTGIITKLASEFEETGLMKYIEEIVSPKPIIGPKQLELWTWMAEYYMCTIGEVMETALPGYFKLSSERFYRLTEHQEIEGFSLEEETEMLLDAIRSAGQISMQDLKSIFTHRKATYYLQVLIDKGLVEPVEIVSDKYKPKYEKYIDIASEYKENNESINHLFQSLIGKSPKQYQVLIDFYSIYKQEGSVKKSILSEKSDSHAVAISSLKTKGIFLEYSKQIDRFSMTKNSSNKKVHLSEKQEDVYKEMTNIFKEKNSCLLRGITGSGKTEIYIQWIQEALERNETVLYILPEIALTQQIVTRLSIYFGTDFLVYHSLVSANKKYELWNKVLRNEAKLIVGTRSSVFLPFTKLDRIIIDEEHDGSLKQMDANPKFHARDSLIHYARLFDAKILLGSATPSVDSYFNVLEGKYGYLELLERYGLAQIPKIEIVNLKDPEVILGMKGDYSAKLFQSLELVKGRGEQSILFQNRRGYSPYIQCNTCGDIPKCINCDVSLTYHSFQNILICHYCAKKYPMAKLCGNCKSPELKTKGLGTQKVEEEIQLFLPDLKLGRLDTDVAKSALKIDSILEEFKSKRLDVLIGTQMVSKGLDFENLTLLGVIQADVFFSIIDYKSDEKAYQVLSQVCGRVGRGKKPGLVIIQTMQPEHKVLRYVVDQDWNAYISDELASRKEFIYPPYCRMIKIDIRHLKLELVEIYAQKIADKIKEQIPSHVMGPVTPMITRIRNQYIKEIIIKLPRNKELRASKNLIKSIVDSELITMPNKNFSIEIIVDI